ncbi:MAG: hypothetical protein KatS3mg103_0480 [Phycisphaerales bacterium]|nr:MAG: hypothetical protein KatS3mg103_0480 [Phycisphaerales bacterium]
MTTTDRLVPPIDGLDQLIDGRQFLIVTIQKGRTKRLRIGVQDSSVRVMQVASGQSGAWLLALVSLVGLLATIGAYTLASAVGMQSGALGVAGVVALLAVLLYFLAQPITKINFYDDMPGGLQRPPLMTLTERYAEYRWYDLRDEQGRIIGEATKKGDQWRIRGIEPARPDQTQDQTQDQDQDQDQDQGQPQAFDADPTTDPQGRDAGPASSTPSAVPSKLLATLFGAIEREVADRIAAMLFQERIEVERHSHWLQARCVGKGYHSTAVLVGALNPMLSPVAVALARKWSRMDIRRAGKLVATGHRIDRGRSLRLEVHEAFDQPSALASDPKQDDTLLDRRHLLALATLAFIDHMEQ